MSRRQRASIAYRTIGFVALFGWLNASCMFGWPVIRQEAKGNHETVVRLADQMRIEPRGKAARARARSLVHLYQYERARAVLLRDFRHGGEIKSLLALADLELKLQREGIALAHYGRVLAIDHKELRGKVRVCTLFDRRGRMMEEMGEMLAADADFRRTNLICSNYSGLKGEDRSRWMAIRSRVRLGARKQLTLQRQLQRKLQGSETEENAGRKNNLASGTMAKTRNSPSSAPVSADEGYREDRLEKRKYSDSALAQAERSSFANERHLPDEARIKQGEGPATSKYEALRQLKRGQPWNALALLPEHSDPLNVQEVEALRKSSFWMLLLLQVAGGETAKQQRIRADEQMGEAWSKRQLELAHQLATQGKNSCIGLPRTHSTCTAWQPYLQGGTKQSESRLGRYLAAIIKRPAAIAEPLFAEAAIGEIEKDLSLQSVGPWIVPLLQLGGHIPLLSALMERLIHAPELVSVGQLEALGIMALALGESSRAVLYFRRAAAQSTEPYAVWSKAARSGKWYESREVELLGIKQAMLHSPDALDEVQTDRSKWLWEAWIVSRLMDASRDPYLRKKIPHAVEAWHREIGEYFHRISPEDRSRRVAQILLEVKDRLAADPNDFLNTVLLLLSGIKDGKVDRDLAVVLKLFSKTPFKITDVQPFLGSVMNSANANWGHVETLIANAIVGKLSNRKKAWQELLARASVKNRKTIVDLLLHLRGALRLQEKIEEGNRLDFAPTFEDDVELLTMILGIDQKNNGS